MQITKMELQQQQQQLITMEGFDGSTVRVLVSRLINVVLALLAVILVFVHTGIHLLGPFLNTRCATLTVTLQCCYHFALVILLNYSVQSLKRFISLLLFFYKFRVNVAISLIFLLLAVSYCSSCGYGSDVLRGIQKVRRMIQLFAGYLRHLST